MLPIFDLIAFKASLGDRFLADQISVGPQRDQSWYSLDDLKDANKGPFFTLLQTIGNRAKTDDRKIIAAAFSARLGWAAVGAIAPLLYVGQLPKLSDSGFSLRFNDQTLFTGIAFDDPAWIDEGSAYGPILGLRPLDAITPYFEALSKGLHAQTNPIVDALHDWSRFSKKGAYGQIYAAWGSVIHMVASQVNAEDQTVAYIRRFFQSTLDHPNMAPDFYRLDHEGQTGIFHRRGSCCLFYRLPDGKLCNSCPLVKDAKRIECNKNSLVA